MGQMDGRKILVVEDDFFLAEDLAESLREIGAQVIGPAASVAEALDLAAGETQVDGAVLDVNLRREKTYPVADALQKRAVPFVFLTGYDRDALDARFRKTTILNKPVDMERLISALAPEEDGDGA